MLRYLRSLFGANAPPPADPRELFAEEVERFLRGVAGVKSVARATDAYGFDVVTDGGKRRAHLENAFAESREMSPQQRRAKIEQFFGFVGALTLEDSWESARDLLVPVLRGATYGLDMFLKQPSAAFVRRSFLPYLDFVVAIDAPTSMRFVSRANLAEWEIDERELFAAAEASFPTLARARIELYDDTHGPLWIVTSNDSYESARLVVPGWLASFKGRVEGEPVAIVPERSTLMVGGDGRPAMLERLVDKAQRECAASNRHLSPALYGVDGRGAVVPYRRHENDELAMQIAISHEKLALDEYKSQKRALDGFHDATGLDVFVADYQVFRPAKGGPPRSVGVWTRGVRSYLPQTEWVALFDPGAPKGRKANAFVEVRFEALLDRLTPVAHLHPPRFETTGAFPNEDDVCRLSTSA